MTPEYLEKLADRADPDRLWRLSPMVRLDLSSEDRKKLDTGIALRRYASHLRKLLSLIPQKRSLLITPISENETAEREVRTPAGHLKLFGRTP